ncbi:hypothetical protein [Saliphagus infecundisoli]|uniref:Uncharacterized protein n=1 Tax=Saliphagus infecundisoli TaxID=1849069 RepID=A0ABD5Q9Z8_9EURY|nr:hypothetical protein [Saliphagus infecundisoli]
MYEDNRPPLPDWILDVYETVLEYVTDQHDSEPSGEPSIPTLPRDQLTRIVLASEPEIEPQDVDYAVDRLLNRGYLYEVDDGLRVTDVS